MSNSLLVGQVFDPWLQRDDVCLIRAVLLVSSPEDGGQVVECGDPPAGCEFRLEAVLSADRGLRSGTGEEIEDDNHIYRIVVSSKRSRMA